MDDREGGHFMFSIQPKHKPSWVEALLLFILMIALISYFIIGLETPPHIPILLAIIFLLAYGFLKGIPYKSLEDAMISGAKSGMGAVFLFFLIGVLISSWMMSGTIPVMI